MPISEKIDHILQVRRDDISPKYIELWEKSKPLIKLAYDVRSLTSNPSWQLLLNRNPDIKKIWDEKGKSAKEFIVTCTE